MNRSELVQLVSRKTRIRPDVVEEVVDATIELVVFSLTDEEPVNLRGFGKFSPRSRPAVKLRHPQTGEPLDVDARRTVVFLPSSLLKEQLNRPPV